MQPFRLQPMDETGVLFDKNRGGITVTKSPARKGYPQWPRSFVSDGYPLTLVLHLAVQIASLAVTIFAAFKVRDEQTLHVIDVIAMIGSIAWGIGVVSLVLIGIVEPFPTDRVIGTSITVAGFAIGFAMTVCLVAFSVRSDDNFTTALGWGITAVCLQSAAIGLFTGCVVNLTARGGRVFTQYGEGDTTLSLQKNKDNRAEALDFQ